MGIWSRGLGCALVVLSHSVLAQQGEQDERSEHLDEIVVQGSYTTRSVNNATGLDLSLRETPQSVTVVTQQQIEDRGLHTISRILEQTAGININQAETDRVFPTARGFTIGNIQFDGMLVGGAAYSVESDFLSDTAVYERVEIIRGAAGLLVGLGTPSAAINLVRKRPDGEPHGSVLVKAGSWDLGRIELDMTSSLGFDGRVRGRMVAAYQQNDSYIDFLSQERTVLYGIVEADVTERTLLTVGVDYQDNHTDGVSYGDTVPLFYSDGGRTDLPRSTTTGTDWSYRDRDRTMSFATLTHAFDSGWSVDLSGSYLTGYYGDERVYIWGYPDRDTGEGLSSFPNASEGDRSTSSLDFRLSGPFSLFGREHEFLVGWNHSREENDRHRFAFLGIPDTGNFFEWDYPYPGFGDINAVWGWETEQSGLFAASRFSITDSLKLIAGARNSAYDYVFHWNGEVLDDVSDSGIVTPYAGVVYDLGSAVSAYASYTGIFDLQTFRDVNNALLDPVEGRNYEIGLKAELFDQGLNVSLALFEVQQENVATFDQVVIVDGQPENRYRAVDGITTEGYEAELSGEVYEGLRLYAGFTHREAKDADGNEVVRQEPENSLRLSGSYTLPAHPGMTLGGAVRWQDTIYPATPSSAVGPNGEMPSQPAYTVADIFLRYQFESGLSLALNVNNLFDEKYYKSVGQFVFGYYGEPRNVTGSIRWSFD